MIKKTGKVWLVGAGPGDPELLTLKAVRVLESADTVIYDRLVSDQVLAMAPKGASRIFVGKQPRHHPMPQDEINALLVKLARAGHKVVRLKGGDPFIFGRGGEEALALQQHDIACEVIPGITAAQGCAAELNVPLTHRDLASGVHYITGHCRQDSPLDFNWSGLSDPRTTLVVYMGLANLAQISGELIAHGRDSATPVLVVNNGTTENQRSLLSDLANVQNDVKTAQFNGPVLFIIGEVAKLANLKPDAASSEGQIHDPIMATR